MLAGLDELARRLHLSRGEMLEQTQRIVHGATVATNALLERKGAKVALLTTEGHRDVLEMREGLKDNRYDLRSPPPEPLVPRQLAARRARTPARRRLGADAARRRIARRGDRRPSGSPAPRRSPSATCTPIAIPHTRSPPSSACARALPDVFVSRSSDVLPQIKEYERVSTTVVNAYVGPAVHRYLTNLERRLGEAGFAGSLFVILSHGGMAPVAEAARLAAATVLSGPAGGVAGARRSAALLGVGDLIPFDMGGTSTDISLIAGGQAQLSAERGLAGERIALRSLDIASIGAGGGSIARVDAAGFHVGPESAGAVPGPACYGNGGTFATVTDANLLLGYLDADNFLGGTRKLDRAASEAAVDRVAAEPEAVARGRRLPASSA